MRVLCIDIDTLRPDHMGCYGYLRDTTPVMDQVAKEGVRFTNYYTPDAPCLPSRASLISGMYGIRHGAVGHGGTAGDRRLVGEPRDFQDPIDRGNLHNIFRKAHMYTASISTFPERHSSWWFNAGLNETHNVGGCGLESGEEVLPVALDWLERRGTHDNWYLHVHLWDPHTPYRAPESFGDPFAQDPIKEWITPEVFSEHKKHVGPHSIMETGMYTDKVYANPDTYCRQPGKCETMEELREFFNGYDTGIRYADFLVGQIINQLKSLGIYDETAIIITSDHGENMGELGIYAEHGTADKATCNIPMIIKWPGLAGGRVDSGLHYNIDLLPTLCDLLGVDPSEHWDGKSFYPELTDSEVESGHPYVVISQNAHVCQRSVRFGKWLYMRTIHDGYHLFEREMLFNLEEDPYEQQNLMEAYPEVAAMGARYILNWQEEQMAKNPHLPDPMWTVMSEGGPYHTHVDLSPYLQRLKDTGRVEGAERLFAKHGLGWSKK